MDKAVAQRLLEVTSEERRDLASDILKDLFPSLEWAFGGTTYSDGFHQQWLAEKRVCSTRYFPRYFELQTATGEMSEREFANFVEATADEAALAAIIAEVRASDLTTSLAARLDETVERLPEENAATLLPAMLDIAQGLAGGRNVDPFNSPWVSAWRATNRYLKRIPEKARGTLILEALRKTGALSVAAILINLSDPVRQEEQNRADFAPALDLTTVEAMKVEWLKQIRERAVQISAMLAEPDLMSLLLRWREYGSEDEPRKWIEEAIKTDEGFAIVVDRMMNRGKTSLWGDRVSTPYNTFQRETVEEFIGIDIAKARCDVIDPTTFPEHEAALRTLLRHVEMWLGLRERDPFDL